MQEKLEDVVITDEQAERINEWIEANAKVPGWLDGYPLGKSYIDTRANSGKGIVERRRYVRLDHDVAKAVPELQGFLAHEIKEFMELRTSAGLKP